MKSQPHPPTAAPSSKRRAKGIAWVAVGVSILLGGSTLALWSASEEFTGGTINAGDLNIEKKADTTFWDASPDRGDRFEKIDGTYPLIGLLAGVKAHKIKNIDTWSFVPGDTVAAAFQAKVTLEGDNMVAKLSLDGLDNSVHNFPMEHAFSVYMEGVEIIKKSPLPDGASEVPLFYLSATGVGQNNGLEDGEIIIPPLSADQAKNKVLPMVGESRDFTVVVYNEAKNVDGREGVKAQEIFGNISLKLDQVRDKGNFF